MLKYAVTRPVTNVVVFGCGGTGSRLIPLVTQLLSSHEFTKNVKVILVDGDIVEDKNTKRQLFTRMDVGKNKAEVLAKRYKLGFEAKTMAVPGFVPSVETQTNAMPTLMSGQRSRLTNQETIAAGDFYDDFFKAVLEDTSVPPDGTRTWISTSQRQQACNRLFSNTTVFVSCVDSADARRRILQFLNNIAILGNGFSGDVSNSVVIDCGNEDLFGQVTYFNLAQIALCPFQELVDQIPDKVPYAVRLPFVPMPLNFYFQLRDAEVRLSCADMDQTLAINNTMANLAFSIFQNLVYGLEMDFHTIYANINGTYTTERLTLPWLKGVLTTNEKYLRGVVDGMEELDYKGKVPTLEDLKSNWIANPQPTSNFSKMASLAFFGFTPTLSPDTIKYPITMEGVKRAFFTSDASPSVASHSVFNVYNNLQGNKITPFLSFTSTSALISSWTEVVWPILAKGLSTGFVQPTEALKKYAVLTSTFGLCSTPLLSPLARNNAVANLVFQTTFGLGVVPNNFVILNNQVSFTFGDFTLSDERARETFMENMVLPLNLKDSITGEDISVVMPSVKGELLSLCRLRIQQHRVDETGLGRPSENRETIGVLSSIVCYAILSSMSKAEIEVKLKELKDESKSNACLMFKPVKNLMASARGYSLGINGVGVQGALVTGDLQSWFQNPHEKYGKALMLFGEGETNSRIEGNMKIFGKTIAKSDICISTGARVYQEKELEKLSAEAVKGTVIERVLAA